MDLLYHAAVGVIIAKATSSDAYVSTALFSTMPDLIGATPFFINKLKHADTTTAKSYISDILRFTQRDEYFATFDKHAYLLSHSLLAVTVVAFITYIYDPSLWHWWTLAYASHLFIDIPTHRGGFSTRLFYPFANWHIEGENWAKSISLFVTFWTILAGVGWYVFVGL